MQNVSLQPPCLHSKIKKEASFKWNTLYKSCVSGYNDTEFEVPDLFPFTFTIKVTIYITHTDTPLMIPLEGKLFVP